MDLINKTLCLLLFGFLGAEIIPQQLPYISTNGNINNSFITKNIYNVSNFSPLISNNSSEILDSLICIYLDGNKTKNVYNYNSDLSLNYFTSAYWFNAEWIISGKHTNTYNSEGKLESVLRELFNSSTGEWFKDWKDVYNYDSLGNRYYYLHQYFNGQEFVNDFKYENCYDTANNLLSSVNQDWIDGIWVKRSRSVYTYTPENLNDSTLFQFWTNDKWVNYQLNIYEYDQTPKLISNLAKRWQDDNWLNFGIGKFEYDVNNNCVLVTWEIASNNNWENWFKISYEYNNNNLTHLFGEEWENGQWVPENELLIITNPDGIKLGFLAKEIFLFYSKPTSVGSEKNIAKGFNLLPNYPNPFNPSTKISFSIPEKSFVTLKVYDVLGREVSELVNENKPAGIYEVEFNAADLPSGVYIYRLQAGAFTESRKMILTK